MAKVKYDGYVFDSLPEMKRYKQLKMEEEGGEISNIEVHPHWDLIVDGRFFAGYTADFKYKRRRPFGGESLEVVEDVKGFMRDRNRYIIKLWEHLYPQYDFYIIDSKTFERWECKTKAKDKRKKKK